MTVREKKRACKRASKGEKNMTRRKLFFNIVKSPWISGLRDAPRDFEPKSTIYDDGEFFIAELFDDSYLFFKKIGEGFFAFNNLAGHEKDYIPKIKQALIDGDTKGDFLVQRGVEAIQKWERSLTTDENRPNLAKG